MSSSVEHTSLRWGDAIKWFDARQRGLGMWAFVLNRVTGILLTLYLLLHFVNISALFLGETAWNRLMDLFRTPPFLVFDVLLLLVLLYHGLNGIRLVLLALNVGVRRQKALFWGLMAFGALFLAYGAVRLFSV
jgi:succinate dehydrogenase / fumarate reductase cytochrome b subunit